MKIKPLFVALTLLITTNVFAQVPSRVYKNGRVPIWLDLGVGYNLINSCDLGVSPQNYSGFGANCKAGFTIEWRRYQIQAHTRGLYNVLANRDGVTSTNYGFVTQDEFLYNGLNFGNGNNWHLWYGGGVQAFFDIKSRSHLMNASFGYTSFINLSGICMIRHDYHPVINGKHNLFSFYAKLSLPLVGWAKRPDFSYIGNATIDPSNALSMMKYYETFAMAVPGASTDIGFVINLPNSNRIGFSYCWDYFTTRHNGVYRYDHAIHSFNTTFMFNIN